MRSTSQIKRRIAIHHGPSLQKFGAQHASDYYDVPFTITTHAHDLYKEPIGEYTNTLLRRADRIVTISEYNGLLHLQHQFAGRSWVAMIEATEDKMYQIEVHFADRTVRIMSQFAATDHDLATNRAALER